MRCENGEGTGASLEGPFALLGVHFGSDHKDVMERRQEQFRSRTEKVCLRCLTFLLGRHFFNAFELMLGFCSRDIDKGKTRAIVMRALPKFCLSAHGRVMHTMSRHWSSVINCRPYSVSPLPPLFRDSLALLFPSLHFF